MARLQGPIEKRIHRIRELFVQVFSVIEGHLDFTETDTEYLDQSAVTEILSRVDEELQSAEQTVTQRTRVDPTTHVLLVGPPNAGKSSLFSTWIPEKKTLVSPVPGTTRDLLEGQLDWASPLTLWDAPGVFEADDDLEKESIARLFQFFAQSDLFLVILDGHQAPPPAWIHEIERRLENRPYLVAIGRGDLDLDPDVERLAERLAPDEFPVLKISVQQGWGLDALKARLIELAQGHEASSEETPWAVDTALLSALGRAREAVGRALSSDLETEIELAVFELREALFGLTPWVGEIDTEEILDQIFSRFCIGK